MTPEQIQEIIVDFHRRFTRGIDKDDCANGKKHKWAGEQNGWANFAAKKIHEEIEEEKSQKNREVVELLRYSEVLCDVDDDVAELAVSLMPPEGQGISMAELTAGIQKIKDSLSQPSSENVAAVDNRAVENDGSTWCGDAGELKTEDRTLTDAIPKDAPERACFDCYCENPYATKEDRKDCGCSCHTRGNGEECVIGVHDKCEMPDDCSCRCHKVGGGKR